MRDGPTAVIPDVDERKFEESETTPSESLVQDVVALAKHLAQYQDALSFVCVSDESEVQARLLALTFLAEPLDRAREEVLDFCGVSKSTLDGLEGRGLIAYTGNRVALTMFGESFLALLSLFNKNLAGGLSEGFMDLTQAVAAGKWSPEFVARLLIGAQASLRFAFSTGGAGGSLTF